MQLEQLFNRCIGIII